MKERISSLVHTKRNRLAILVLLIVFITALPSKIAIADVASDKESVKNSFYRSINYDMAKGLLKFTIPKTIPKCYKFYLHISGRIYLGTKSSGMSFHAFDEESTTYSWKNGKTYTYPLNSKTLDECILVFGFVDANKHECLYTVHISHNGAKRMESGS